MNAHLDAGSCAGRSPPLATAATADRVLVLVLVGVGLAACAEVWHGRGPRRIGAAALLGLAVAGVGLALPGSFVHQKVVGRLLMPLGWATLAVALATALALRARRWRAAATRFALLAGIVSAGSGAVGAALLRPLEAQIPPDPGGRFDAVLVLGGGTRLGPEGQVELGSSGDRLRRGAALYHQGRTTWLVASGRSPLAGRERDLSEETTRVWEEMGVDPNRVLHLPEPTDTAEEVAAFAALCRERGFGRVGVVSSAWHLPRVLAHAEDRGLDAVPLAAHHHVGPPTPPNVLDFIPSAHGLRLTEIWAWETLGRLLAR